MIVRSVARESRIASAGGAQVAGDQRQVGGLDRDVGAGADRQAEVGLGERGRVVDAVADHRHDAALGLQPRARRRPCRRAAPRRSPRRCRPRPRPRAAVAALSPVSSTGRSPSARSDATASARRRLDGVGDDEQRRAPRRPRPTSTAVRPCASAARRAASSSAGTCRLHSAISAGRPTCTPWPSTTPSTPRPSRLAKPSTAGSAPSSSRAARGDRLRDRVLGGVLERAGEPQHARRGPRRRRRRRRRGSCGRS